MDLPNIPPAPAPKLKQTNCRLNDEQAAALKRHCVRTGQSASDAIIAGLVATIDGFPK